MDEFPTNSQKSKAPKEEVKKDKNIEKVITGTVVEKKKSFASKFRDAFIGGEFKSASSYIVAEVLLPALRNTIVDATTKGIERMIYGDAAPRRSSGRPGPRVSYHSPVDRYSPQQRAYLPGQSANVPQRRQDVSDFIVDSREEAETVVETLGDIISQYEVASVSDLKEMLGLGSSYVDNHWGWSNISYIDIKHVRGGWLIDLPPVEPI